MSAVSATLNARWASGEHVGASRPEQRIEIRTGKLTRGWSAWGGSPVGAKVPGETAAKPWQATWVPTSAWRTLPNVLECHIQQDFDQGGLSTSTVAIENVLYRQQAGNFGQLYHLIDRGALAPWRGYQAPGRPAGAHAPNEWFDLLTHHAQIVVYQGYGDALEKVFTGLIESVDPDSTPDRLTLTVRDFAGPCLVDQHVVGFNNGPRVDEPCIFISKGELQGEALPVGYSPRASSTRPGHLPRFVLDNDPKTYWLSVNKTTSYNTEWVDVRVPRGRYQSFYLNAHYPGMQAWVGVYARNRGMGGEDCRLDELDIRDGWINLAALSLPGGGMVPGTIGEADGGWPYVMALAKPADKLTEIRLPFTLDLGDDSLFRIAFRDLKMIGPDAYRAGVARFQPIKRKLPPAAAYRTVGKSARSSSSLPANGKTNYRPANVIDAKRDTRWVSRNRPTANDTEWVSIRLPQGTYDRFQIEVMNPGYEMYVGVYARPRTKKPANIKPGEAYRVVYLPCKVDGVEVPNAGYENGQGDWINLTAQGEGGTVPGSLPPAGDGGWPYMKKWDRVDLPAKKAETYKLGHKLELGNNSVLRIGFRNLHQTEPGSGIFRASVRTLRALTKSGVKQPEKLTTGPAKIEVDDVSDIVRVALRWGGFKEWEVENTGTRLATEMSFNRTSTLRDIIKKVEEATGYVFFMDRPSDWDGSIGVPIFREARALKTIGDVPVVRDSDLLTGIQAHITEEPLSAIIRIRGNPNPKGLIYGHGTEKRLMTAYAPPWARDGRLAHVLKHFIHTDDRLKDQQSLEVFARLVAVRQALESATATVELPGTPAFGLDDHVALLDEGTGFNTRLYIVNRTTVFQTGRQASYKTTLGGSLLDTPDFTGAMTDLLAILPPGRADSITSTFAQLSGDVEPI